MTRNVLRYLFLAFAAAITLFYLKEAWGIWEYTKLPIPMQEMEATEPLKDFFRNAVYPFIVLFLVVLAAYCTGRFAVGLIGRGFGNKSDSESKFGMSNTEWFIYSTGLGLAIVGVLVWIIGWLGILYKPLIIGLLLILPAIFYRNVPEFLRHFRVLFDHAKGARRFDQVLLGLTGIWVLYSIFLTLNPSVGFDPISTHLYTPKYYLENHAISFKQGFYFLQLHSMIAILQMSFLDDPGSLLPYLMMLMTSATLYLIGRQMYNRSAGLFAALMYILLPISNMAAMNHLNEHTMIFFIVLMVHGFTRYRDTDNVKWLYLSGAAAGAACSVDYNAIIPAAIIMVFSLKNFWRFLLWTVIFAAPFYILNVIYYGNPIFPFYDEYFRWANWGILEQSTSSMARTLEARQQVQVEETSVFESLTALWRYTWEPNVQWENRPVGRIGPFIIGLTPLIFLAKWKKQLKTIGLFIVVAYLYWFLYERFFNARFLMYLFALHGLLGAYALAWAIGQQKKNKSWIQYTAAAVLAIFALVVTVSYTPGKLYVTSEKRLMYTFAYKPGIQHVFALNKNDPDVTVYMLGLEDYNYYCDFDIVGRRYGDQKFANFYVSGMEDPGELWEWLRSLECKYILANLGYLTSNDMNLDFTPIFNNPEFYMYFAPVPVIRGEFERPDMATRVYRILDEPRDLEELIENYNELEAEEEAEQAY